jgi:hypothetical protein
MLLTSLQMSNASHELDYVTYTFSFDHIEYYLLT